MDRSCAVQQIVDNIKTNVIGVGRNSVTPIPNKSLQFLLPVGGMNGMNEQLKSKDNTYKWAKQIQNTANTIYVSKLYGNIIDIDNESNPNGTLITITVSTKLVDHYVKKDGMLPAKLNRFHPEYNNQYWERAVETSKIEKYLGDKDINDSKSILNNIINNLDPDKSIIQVAKKLLEHVDKNNVSIWLEDVEYFDHKEHDFKGIAHYDPLNNRIHIARYLDMSDKEAARILVHEILHALTHHSLKNNSAESRHFKALYEYAKANMKSEQYGLYSIDEFIVALFTDSAFIMEARNIPAMNKNSSFKNLFEELFNYLLRVFNITKKDSFYEEAFAVATHIVNDKTKAMSASQQFDKALKDNTILPYKYDEPLFDVTYLRGNPNLGTLKKYSVRPENSKPGVYNIDGNLYNITKVYETPVFANTISNLKEIRAKSIGDDPIKFEHIKDFYDNKKPMFVYKIDKIESNASNKKKVLNNEPKVSNLQNKQAKQEIFFKRLLKELNKRMINVTSKLAHDKLNKEYLKEHEDLKTRIETITASFHEYLDTKNKSLLVTLAKVELARVEEYINEIEKQFSTGNFALDADELVKNVNILHIFMELNGVKEDASALYERLKPGNGKNSIITRFVLNMASEQIGKELTEEDLEYDSKDIFVGERWFGTLSDVNNYIAKTVGFLIKKAQNKIATDNRKSFEEVDAADKQLAEWAKENGMSKQEAFNLFIQDIGKTTILTKEFTTEFLDLIKKGRSIENNGQRLTYFKSFAKYDPTIAGWRPLFEKHYNPNYKKIFSTPALKQYYIFFKSSIDRLREDFPINLRENFIPDIAEQSLIDIMKSDKSVAAKFKDSLSFITEIYDYDYDKNKFISDEELLTDDIPMRYIGNLDSDIKSRDLSGSLLKFLYFANFHKEMTNVLPKTRLLQEEIGSRNYLDAGKTTNRMTGQNSNIYKMTQDFIEMQVKGKMRKDNESLKNFNYSKYIDFGIKYTSLLRIGLNPFNAVTNVIVGSIGNLVESVGGRYFTTGEFMKANKTFFSQVFNENSKVNILIKLLNPLMELEDYANLDAIRIGSKDYHDRIKNLMYAPQRIGEKMMQVSTMIANLMHDTVTTKEGKTISLWEAFDENGVWNEALMGYKFDENMVFKTTNKIQRINQMIHGRYSAKDAAAAQQYALVRAAYQFKKWIPAAIESRFISKRFDDRLGYEIEGRYRTLWNESASNLFTNPILAFKNLLQPLLDKKGALADGRLSELEVYNMRKNAIELIIILTSYLMFLGLGDDDDDERTTNGWYKFAMMQLDRTTGDLLMWYNPDKAQKSFVGVPLTKTITDLGNIVQNIPYAFGIEGSTYEKGYRKGENKFVAKVIDATPVVKPLADFFRGFKDVPYEELRD